ncbi:glycoside hydrolase family 43 protein [Nibricoccus sp. IMCC34717]|uniref:glycoside hydrolase family 43 protein n=1 Tax=Nibricoccus sp. IMCC34717 TaxID=3034021 RepID=UPI00384FC1B1
MRLLSSLAFLLSLALLSPMTFASTQAQPAPVVCGERFLDTAGQPVNAHGAGILEHNGWYYLYGEIKQGRTWLVERTNWECYRVDAGGVSCYRSKDLLTWENLGVALPAVRDDKFHDLHPSRVIERPKVIFNEKTGKFVMWMHVDSEDYLDARAGVAVADKPEGPFTYIAGLRPNGYMARDLGLFKDDDGKAYLLVASENNETLHIVLLSDDYLRPSGTFARAFVGLSREAPAMFKHKGIYHMITSACTGWDPNPAGWASALSPLGPWTMLGNPCIGAGAEKTFGAQSTFVLPLKGDGNSFLFLADRWNKLDLEKSTYLWLPLQMVDGKPVIDGSVCTGK